MKKHLYLIIFSSLFLAFIIFTVLVKTVDVYYIAYNNSYIGFHTLNYKFANFVNEFGKYKSMIKMSDIIFYISFAYTLVLLVFAIIEIVKTKSLKKINTRWYLLLGGYVVTAIFYLVFEVCKVNYSPDSVMGKLKPSYPSSHIFVGSMIYLLNTYTAIKLLKPEKKWIAPLVYSATILICVLLVFTRSLSTKHWLTDVIGSILLVSCLYPLFIYLSKKFLIEGPIEPKEEAIE